MIQIGSEADTKISKDFDMAGLEAKASQQT
jgi:hypothetical protein